jgi:hypothetical protein
MSLNNQKKIIQLLKEYNSKYGDILTESKLKVLVDKVGLNEDVAKVFDQICGSLAVWMAKKLYQHYVRRTMNFNVEKNMTKEEIKTFAIYEINRLSTNLLRQVLTPTMDYIRVGLNGNISSLENDSWGEIIEKQKQWHDSLNIGEGAINYVEKNPILIDFRNENGEGYYWVDLETRNSPEECERMGHCGRSSYGYLYSLRSDRGLPGGKYKLNRSHLTAAIGEDGILYQLKGPKNSKPKEEYHQYIKPLFYTLGGGGEQEDYLIQGFGTEYGAEQDFKLSDLPDTTIRKIYNDRPELFNTRGLKRKLGEMGIIKVEPTQTRFVLEIKTKDIGDYLEGNKYWTRKYKNSEGKEVTKRIGYYEQIMSDSVWDLADGIGWGEDWESALDYYVDRNNEKLIESMINEWISKSGDEVDEDISLEEKIEKYDDNYDIRNALSGAENDVASGEYVNYLRNTLKSALQEYGSVFEFNDEKIKIQIDLKDYLGNFNEDEIDEFYENCNDIPACVFDELLNVDFITKPKPSFSENWSPDINNSEYNQSLKERLNEI